MSFDEIGRAMLDCFSTCKCGRPIHTGQPCEMFEVWLDSDGYNLAGTFHFPVEMALRFSDPQWWADRA